jgi:hypothetical protein
VNALELAVTIAKPTESVFPVLLPTLVLFAELLMVVPPLLLLFPMPMDKPFATPTPEFVKPLATPIYFVPTREAPMPLPEELTVKRVVPAKLVPPPTTFVVLLTDLPFLMKLPAILLLVSASILLPVPTTLTVTLPLTPEGVKIVKPLNNV